MVDGQGRVFGVRKTQDAAAENFGDNGSGIAGAVDAEIGELVGGEALGVQRAEAGFVAEQRAAGHGHATSKENFYGSVEPDHGDAGVAQKFRSARLGIGAAAESKDCGFTELDGSTESGAQLISFELAEGRFAVAFEKFRNGNAGGGFDTLVKIDEAPAELTRQTSAHSAFAGAHEAGEANDGRFWRKRATDQVLIHDFGER